MATPKETREGDSTPRACSPREWHLAATELAPRGIYLLIGDNYGRTFEGMLRKDGWEMLRTKGDTFEVWWWAYLPDHPGMPPENV